MIFHEAFFRCCISFQTHPGFTVKLISQLVLKQAVNRQLLQLKYVPFSINRLFKSTESPEKPIKPQKQSKSSFKAELFIQDLNSKQRHRGYTPEDDKFIVEEIKLQGNNKNTHKYIAKVLGLTDYRCVAERYRTHLSGKTFSKRRFSPEEDKIILDYVEKHGKNKSVPETLLNGRSYHSIRHRLNRLTSNNEYDNISKHGIWKLEEEEKLIRNIMKMWKMEDHDIKDLENVTVEEFVDIARTLERSTYSCFTHWNCVVVPALKTHILGLPFNSDWKLDMMNYILDNKIEHEKDIDIDYLIANVIPGQTKFSVSVFKDSLRAVWQTNPGKRIKSKEPLNEVVKSKFKIQSPCNPCFNPNHQKEEQRLKRGNDIIFLYNLYKN